jgi:hypothetical protein
MVNLVLLCRRHHVLWHLGRLGLHSLRIPWHADAGGPPGHPVDRLFVSGTVP